MGSEGQDQRRRGWEGTCGCQSVTEAPRRASRARSSRDRRPVLGQSLATRNQDASAARSLE